jgi:hypothetical protein
MILRRLSEHVKAQNWFAVALDFIIVVVGILIAFQITAWNEQRADRAKEALYLSELIEDLNADLAEIDSIKRTAEIRMGALERILALAGAEPRRTLTFDAVTFTFDPAPPFQSDDPYEANIQLTNTPDLDGSRETFQALISTGDLGLIRNRDLARQTQTYYAAMTEANNLEGAGWETLINRHTEFVEPILFSLIEYGPQIGVTRGTDAINVIRFDYQRMRNEADFRAALSALARTQSNQRVLQANQLALARQVLAELDAR